MYIYVNKMTVMLTAEGICSKPGTLMTSLLFDMLLNVSSCVLRVTTVVR